MRTINLYGVVHAHPSDNVELPEFLRQVCEAIELTVPVADVYSEVKVREAALKKLRNDHEDSIKYSWVSNPERMRW